MERDDEAGYFGLLVAARLRLMSREDFEAARREIARVLKLPIQPL